MEKVYMFLLNSIDKTEYEASSNTKVYGKYVYAITDDKKKAKEFMLSRNMDLFSLEVFDVGSDEEYIQLLRQKSMMECELSYSTFPTSAEYNGYLTIEYVTVLCTVKESDAVEYDYDSYILDKIENVIAGIDNLMHEKFKSLEIPDSLLLYESLFNNEIQDALDELNFRDFLEDATYQIDNIDSSEYSLNEDKLKVYCIKFSNTYKEGLGL